MEKSRGRRFWWPVYALVLLLLVNACNDSDSSPSSDTDTVADEDTGGTLPPGSSGDEPGTPVTVGNAGRIGLVLAHHALSDGRFSEINLTVTAIELLSDVLPAATIFSGEQQINLLSVKQFSQLMVLTEQAPAGVYNKIRLTLKQPEGLALIPADGGDPVFPSLPGNGKIDLNPRNPFEVTTDSLLMLQLDMDANKSIHMTGAGNTFRFRPVVFVNELRGGQKSDLLRIDGYAHSIVDSAGTLTFCLDPVPEPDVITDLVTSCLPVSVTDASIFDRQAQPALAADIAIGHPLTVAGLVEGFSSMANSVAAAVTILHDDDDDGGAGITPASTETRLLAEVVEIDAIGARFRLQAVIKTAPTVADEVFVFDSFRGGNISGLNIPGQLQPGARILDRKAARHDHTAITVGRKTGLDGAPSMTGEANAMKVTLALLSDEAGAVLPDQISGVIQSISATDGILMLNDVMVTVTAETLIISSRNVEGVLTSSGVGLTDLIEGTEASVFGQSQPDGSLVADVVLSST